MQIKTQAHYGCFCPLSPGLRETPRQQHLLFGIVYCLENKSVTSLAFYHSTTPAGKFFYLTDGKESRHYGDSGMNAQSLLTQNYVVLSGLCEYNLIQHLNTNLKPLISRPLTTKGFYLYQPMI